MKAKKKILVAVGIVILVLVAAVLLLVGNLNNIVKGVIEKAGTRATGVAVTVKAVDIKIREGSAAITGLSVANPEGFSAKPMLDFGKLAVKADFKTSVINHIKVASPHILFEQKESTSNFQTLQDNMSKKSEDKPKEEPEQPPAEGEPAVIQIDLIEITDAQVTVISDKEDKPRNVTIPSMEFKDLKGTAEEISKQLMGQLTKQIIKEVAGKAIQGELDKAIDKSIGDKLGDKLNFLKKKEPTP